MKKTESNREISLLLQAIDQGFDHAAWHGPNLRSALRGVTPQEAGWRPAPGRHNIWELAVHAAYWKYVVRRIVQGGKKGSFVEKGSNWFPRGDAPDSKAWRKDLALLENEQRLLRATVAALDPVRLSRPVSKKGRTLTDVILGVAFHDIYHAGQIRLLRRLQSRAR